MAEAPKPVGVVALQALHSRTVELAMVRVDALPRLEGADVVFASGPLDAHGRVRSGDNGGRVRVLAVRERKGGGVEVLLPARLSALVPAVAYGDGVYLADDVGPSEEAKEAAYVEAWKAGEEVGDG